MFQKVSERWWQTVGSNHVGNCRQSSEHQSVLKILGNLPPLVSKHGRLMTTFLPERLMLDFIPLNVLMENLGDADIFGGKKSRKPFSDMQPFNVKAVHVTTRNVSQTQHKPKLTAVRLIQRLQQHHHLLCINTGRDNLKLLRRFSRQSLKIIFPLVMSLTTTVIIIRPAHPLYFKFYDCWIERKRIRDSLWGSLIKTSTVKYV